MKSPLRPLTPPDSALTLRRPDRFPELVSAPPDARQRVADLRVLVVGAGAVGARLIDGLARLGVGGLDVVDPGFLAPENLATHPIDPDRLGQPKARAAGERALALEPRARVRVAETVAEALPLLDWLFPDLVLLASDHPAVEVEVGQRCLWAGRPLIHAAVHGGTLVAQVRVFGGDAAGPCPACAFGAHEWDLVAGARRFRCDGSGPQAPDAPPTSAPGFLCSLAADLALNEVLALALGRQDSVDQLIEHCGFTRRTIVAPLVRRESCRCEHRALAPLGGFDAARATAVDLASAAGFPVARTTLAVEGVTFAVHGACETEACPARGRFVTGELATCAACGGPARPHPFLQYDEVPLADVPTRPLGELGLGADDAVVLRSLDDGAVARLEATP